MTGAVEDFQASQGLIQEYVRERLRREVGTERGAAARMADILGIKPAHLSNMLSARPTRNPGPKVIHACRVRWGMTTTQLEQAAYGHIEDGHAPVELGKKMAELGGISREAVASVMSHEKPEEHPERRSIDWFDLFRSAHHALTRDLAAASPLGKGERAAKQEHVAAPAADAAPASAQPIRAKRAGGKR